MGRKQNKNPRSNSSSRWLQRQSKDIYVKRAKAEGLRSRAAFKIEQLDKRDKIFKQGQYIIDLGAAPGGWCEYIVKRIGKTGAVIAVDILPMQPIDGVVVIHGDIHSDQIWDKVLAYLPEATVDVVVSDMAPSLSGIKDRDEAMQEELIEMATHVANRVLKVGGSFVVKLFESGYRKIYMDRLRPIFVSLDIRKPDASRAESKEIYLVAKGFRPIKS